MNDEKFKTVKFKEMSQSPLDLIIDLNSFTNGRGMRNLIVVIDDNRFEFTKDQVKAFFGLVKK